jgi:hypothetical protein
MRRLIALGLFVLCCAALTLAQGGTRYDVDYGAWRVVVLQSDDWGLEAWFPDAPSAEALAETLDGVAARLRPYATSTLETAAEIDSLAAFLASMRDADELPVVLQANTVVAAIDAAEPDLGVGAPGFGFRLRPPGLPGSAYARPDLWEAYGRAAAAGVWRMELHGLVHRDLAAYATAWRDGDPLARRASEFGVVAHEGWRHRYELASGDEERARRTLGEAVRRFEELAGYRPVSFIAPDYHWDDEDERALAALGLEVIQAKAEQIQPRWAKGSWTTRLLKRWVQIRQRRRGRFLYMDRPGRLEPYGHLDPAAAQGARAAAAAVRDAWRRGEPAVVSIHRVQLSHPDAAIAAAGRKQLAALFEELGGVGTLRILVDAEIAALEREGVSELRRGPYLVYRNFGAQPRAVRSDQGTRFVLQPGTTLRHHEDE